MSDQHERLKEARIKAGFETAADAARAIGVKVPGYNHHENGTRKLKYATAERYARALKTTADWLMGGKTRDVAEGGPRSTREVTKLSWVSAGRLGPVDPIESVPHTGRIRMDELPPGEWLMLQVRGRSMDRIAPENSSILVNRRDKALISGRYFVIASSDGEATFKRYRRDPDRFVPYSFDGDEEPIYPDHEADREWQVIGRVHRVIIEV